MFTIRKSFHFSASHQLLHLPESHPCSRMHGHNYVVEIELASKNLNKDGFVRDYNELDELKQYIDSTLDHRHINDVLGDDNTTAEHLCLFFYTWCKERWPETLAIRISETPKTWAEYRPIA